jgi:hypothetical protein
MGKLEVPGNTAEIPWEVTHDGMDAKIQRYKTI